MMVLTGGVFRNYFFFGKERVDGALSKLNDIIKQSYYRSEQFEGKERESIKCDKFFKSKNFADFGHQTSMNTFFRRSLF